MAIQTRSNVPEALEGEKVFEENVVQIYRCAKVVKGGRRFSFGALVVVGDRSGHVGLGYGKANEVPMAIDKGIGEAKKHLVTVKRRGRTIPHQVWGTCGASKVVLVPASEGTGVIAGKKLRPLLELAGWGKLSGRFSSLMMKGALLAGLRNFVLWFQSLSQ